MTNVAFADYVDGKVSVTGSAKVAGPNITAAFNALAYNAGFTEAGDRAGLLSRRSLDGRRERVFLSASSNLAVLDSFAAYRSRALSPLS